MSEGPPVRIAVVGLGFMGSTHLQALRGVRGAVLQAVYSALLRLPGRSTELVAV